MNTSLYTHIARRRDDEPRDSREDPGLRALFANARGLIDALEAGADETTLRERVKSYVRCAASQGVSRARIHMALECLFEEHGAGMIQSRCA